MVRRRRSLALGPVPRRAYLSAKEGVPMTSPSGPSRRQVLAATAAAVAAPLVAAAPAHASGSSTARTYDLTLLGTSDTHGCVYNWDYYRDAEYDDSAHND